jgi:hypothetical protein
MDLQDMILILIVVLLVIAYIAWYYRRSRSLLDRWAERNGYRIVDSEYRYFFRGPFFWTSSKEQTVYRVTVADKAGNVWSGWVRCGGWWLGLLSDQAEARWDEVPASADDLMRDRSIDE